MQNANMYSTNVDYPTSARIDIYVENGKNQTKLGQLNKFLQQQCNYDHILLASPMTMLQEIKDRTGIKIMTPAFKRYVMTHVDGPDDSQHANTWTTVTAPFLSTCLEYLLELVLTEWRNVANQILPESQALVAVIMPYTYKPTVSISLRSRDKFLAMVDEGCAFIMTNPTLTRGNYMGRLPARLLVERIVEATDNIRAPHWHATNVPKRGTACVAIVIPCKGTVWFFRLNDGMLKKTRPIVKSNSKHFVVECYLDKDTDCAVVYDVIISEGCRVDMNPKLKDRLASIASHIKQWPNFEFAKYGSAFAGANNSVIFVKDNVCPTDISNTLKGIYLWKPPTLGDGQCVMMCQHDKCTAQMKYGEPYMGIVGNIQDITGVKHLCVYVMESCDEYGQWRVIRPARKSERIFTLAECISGTACVQVTERKANQLIQQTQQIKNK